MRAALLVVIAACIEPTATLHCGSDICPLDSTCVDDSRCVQPSEISACTGIALGAECVVENLPGRCTDHGGITVCDAASCGDGVVDASLHEQCDTTAGAEQCLDLGFDLGRPGCDTACSFDTSSCARFGWKLVTNAPVTQMWSDGTTLAYLRSNPTTLAVHGGGYEVDVVDAFGLLAGGGGKLFVTDSTGVDEVGPSSLTALPTPPVDARAFDSIAVDASGVLWAATPTDIYAYDGAWTKRNVDNCAQCSAIHAFLDHEGVQRIFVMENFAQVYELLPGGLLQFRLGFAGYGFDLGMGADDALYAASSAGFFYAPPGVQSSIEEAAGAFVSIATVGNDVYTITEDGTVARWNGVDLDRTEGPTIGALASDGTTLYEYRGPIFAYANTAFGSLVPAPLAANETLRAVVALPDGGIEVATDQVFDIPYRDGSGWFQNPLPYGISLSGFSGIDEQFVAVVGTLPGSTPHPIVAHYTDSWHEIETANYYAYTAVWMAQDQSLVTVAADGHVGIYDSAQAAWAETQELGCAMQGVGGAATIESAIIVGGCNGVAVIWNFTDAWHVLYTASDFSQPLAAVKVFATGEIYAVGDSGAVWFDGTAWHEDPTVPGRSIDGTSPADVWVAGSFTNVQHYDGSTWSQMTTRGLGPMLVAAQRDRIVMPGAAKEHVTLLR